MIYGVNIYDLNIYNIDLNPIYIDYVLGCNIFNNKIKLISSLEVENIWVEITAIEAWLLYDSKIYNNSLNISGLSRTYGIKINSGENIHLENNNISVSGLEKGLSWSIGASMRYFSMSLAIENSHDIKILNNFITSSVCGEIPSFKDSGYSTTVNILISNSNNTLFDSNYIYTKGNYYVYGIHMEGQTGSNNNNFTNNFIYSQSIYYTNAIQIGSGCVNSYIFNNTLICNSTNITYGINLLKMGSSTNQSFNNYIINNTILCYSYFNQGIQLYNSENNNIDGNYIYANGSISLGISLGGDSYNNKITNNDIIAIGDKSKEIGSNYVDDINLENTGIKLKGRGKIGTSNNTITNNRIQSSGENHIILSGNNNKISDNIIISLKTVNFEVYNPIVNNSNVLNDFNNQLINTTSSNNPIENIDFNNPFENTLKNTGIIGFENSQAKSYELKKEDTDFSKNILNNDIVRIIGFIFFILIVSFCVGIYYKKTLQK